MKTHSLLTRLGGAGAAAILGLLLWASPAQADGRFGGHGGHGYGQTWGHSYGYGRPYSYQPYGYARPWGGYSRGLDRSPGWSFQFRYGNSPSPYYYHGYYPRTYYYNYGGYNCSPYYYRY